MDHVDNDIIKTILLLSKLSQCAELHAAHERTREIGRRALDELPPLLSSPASSPIATQE